MVRSFQNHINNSSNSRWLLSVGTEELPEGNWYCAQCSCWVCGDVVNEKEALGSPIALKCSQCEHNYHDECLKGKGIAGAMPNAWFCGESCQAVHSGLNSQIGLVNSSADGFSWTLLRCIHGDQKVHSAQRYVALKAECNLKLAVALTIMEECFLPMVDPRTGIDMIPHVLYNWGSEFARLNYHGFHTVVLEKDDVLMSVASIRIHGVAVAEMPLIATCSKYRRQGMCRRLMNAIEEMLKSFKVEKLVVSAIPSLVETWTDGFGFTPLEDHEKESLSRTNLMVFPGTIWLKKPLTETQVAVQETDNPPEAVVCLEDCPEGEPSIPNNTSSGSEANCENGFMHDDGQLFEANPCQDGNMMNVSSYVTPASALETDNPPEAVVCLEDCLDGEPSIPNNTSSGSEANCENGFMHDDGQLSEANPCQDGNMTNVSSYVTPASALENNLAEADCNIEIETVTLYDNREPLTNEQSEKTELLHRNEISQYI